MAYWMNSHLSLWPVFYLILMYVSDSACVKIRYSIPEELDLGAFVGNIAADLGLDVKQLLERRFRIASEDKKQYLDVNLKTGALVIKEKLDREQLCEHRLSCILILEAVIENPLKLYRVEIEILDVNDNAPVFQRSEVNIEISEFMPAGTSFLLQSAIDPDAGTDGVRSYQLSPNGYFTLKSQSDSEQNGIPELVLERLLDREQQPTHRLTLTAFDGGTPQKFGSTQININVLDANDNAPVCEQNVYQITTAENVRKNTLIVKVTAVDLDAGLNGEIIYSFTDHTPDRVRDLFSLDSANGEIRVIGTVDFEETVNYQIMVQAKDRGSLPLLGYCKVLIKVTDVNDNSPEIITTSASNFIQENAALNTAVAVLRVADRDSENTAAVYCRINGGIPFKLNSSFNNYYTLVTHGDIDREKVPEYNVTITCTDSGSPPLSTNKTIRVQVTDTNDNAPRFTQPSFTMYVTENNIIGASIGSVSAFDPDSNQNSQIRFDILSRLIHGLPASTFVSINSANGVMFAHQSFDFEQLKNFQICVQVKDAGSPPLSSNVTVNVIITDQNDNAPVILSPLPSEGSAAEDTMPKTADSGYLVAKVTATDADSGQNAQIVYQLLQPTDESLFTVAAETGEIWSIRRFGHKDSLRQKIVILVRDNGIPSLSSTVTINVSVQDDTTENPSNIGMLGTSGPWTSDFKFYLMISFGTISLLLLAAIVILGIKVQRGRTETSSDCCCWHTSYISSRDSLRGIQKASVKIQMPPNYTESGTFPQPFRYDVRQDSDMDDFMFLKLDGVTAPIIDIKTGICTAAEHGKVSQSTSKETTEFRKRKSRPCRPNMCQTDLVVSKVKLWMVNDPNKLMEMVFAVTVGLVGLRKMVTSSLFVSLSTNEVKKCGWRSSTTPPSPNTARCRMNEQHSPFHALNSHRRKGRKNMRAFVKSSRRS
ncbi:protocadherin gamma-B7-like [Heterodontus francisci]|uniref:protocadherin gamma-B7-like n=1 Tax=Heterodontus francisci TaxID=7792 RepID=UPI00355C0053